MELPDSCKTCDKPKKVHLTKVVNQKATKIHLCVGCPLSIQAESKISFGVLDELLKEKAGTADALQFGQTCFICGTTLEEFKKNGRMGCSQCYGTFSEAICGLLPDMHRGTHHCGKIPRKVVELETLEDRVIALEVRIQEAVSLEEYERAAKFRDELIEIKNRIASQGSRSISFDPSN